MVTTFTVPRALTRNASGKGCSNSCASPETLPMSPEEVLELFRPGVEKLDEEARARLVGHVAPVRPPCVHRARLVDEA